MNDRYPFQVMRLPYRYIALAPHCDADTLYLHHDQYYAKRVAELNRLVVQHRLQGLSLQELLTEKLDLPPVSLRRVKDAAGAVYNHELFFDGLTDHPGDPPLNYLVGEIIATYGSMQRFARLLTEAAESLPGVGWVWLVAERGDGLHIEITENNETVNLTAVQPVLVIDLWEHAYFLDDQFDKERYLDNWMPLVNWARAEERFLSAR